VSDSKGEESKAEHLKKDEGTEKRFWKELDRRRVKRGRPLRDERKGGKAEKKKEGKSGERYSKGQIILSGSGGKGEQKEMETGFCGQTSKGESSLNASQNRGKGSEKRDGKLGGGGLKKVSFPLLPPDLTSAGKLGKEKASRGKVDEGGAISKRGGLFLEEEKNLPLCLGGFVRGENRASKKKREGEIEGMRECEVFYSRELPRRRRLLKFRVFYWEKKH